MTAQTSQDWQAAIGSDRLSLRASEPQSRRFTLTCAEHLDSKTLNNCFVGEHKTKYPMKCFQQDVRQPRRPPTLCTSEHHLSNYLAVTAAVSLCCLCSIIFQSFYWLRAAGTLLKRRMMFEFRFLWKPCRFLQVRLWSCRSFGLNVAARTCRTWIL